MRRLGERIVLVVKRFWVQAAICISVALIGLVSILGSHAASYFFLKEPEVGRTSGSMTTVTDSTASGGSAVLFRNPVTADPSVGNVMVWGDTTLAAQSDIKAGQIVLNWADYEPTRGNYCWAGCTSPQKIKSLDSLLKTYHDMGKQTTIQINSSQKPTWIYDSGSGVDNCGTRSVANYSTAPPYDIPRFWNADGTLNAAYFTMMDEMIASFAQALNSSPYKSSILGIRTAPNLIGTEQTIADPKDSKVTITNANCTNWTKTVANLAYARSMKLWYDRLEAVSVRPFMREVAFTNLGSANLDPATYLLSSSANIRPGIFGTSADPDDTDRNKEQFLYDYSRTGKVPTLWEAFINSGHSADQYPNPVSWFWWRQLSDLDRGVSYIANYGDDLSLESSNPEYAAATAFTNKYAGYTEDRAAESPGAWIAFAPGTPGDTTVTHGNFSMFMDQLSSQTTSSGVDSSGPCPATPAQTCPGVNMIGNPNQRFGRWARSTTGTISLTLDAAFKRSMKGNMHVYVTYLDSGSGSWTLKWSTGQQTFTSSPSTAGQWVTTPAVNLGANLFDGSLDAGADLQLISNGGSTTFHMVEVTR